MAVKGNQPALCAEVETFFEEATSNISLESRLSYHEEESRGQGRTEKRYTWASSDIDWMDEKDKWPAIKSIVMITSEGTLVGEKPTFETRFFTHSLPADATTLAKAVRTHWQIENKLHWTLDVAFREDEC